MRRSLLRAIRVAAASFFSAAPEVWAPPGLAAGLPMERAPRLGRDLGEDAEASASGSAFAAATAGALATARRSRDGDDDDDNGGNRSAAAPSGLGRRGAVVLSDAMVSGDRSELADDRAPSDEAWRRREEAPHVAEAAAAADASVSWPFAATARFVAAAGFACPGTPALVRMVCFVSRARVPRTGFEGSERPCPRRERERERENA